MFKKQVYLLIFLIIFSRRVYAEDVFFDFSLEKPLIQSGSDFEVRFNYKLKGISEDNFVIRPIVNRGIVEVWDINNSSWISLYGLRSNLPVFSKIMKLRINGLEIGKASLKFEIQNTLDGEIYNTPQRNVWSENIYLGYIQKLNDHLKAFVNAKMDK